MKKIKVEMARYAISQSPDVLIAQGLGSCVAVCLYDREKKIGGLAHIMLPYFNRGSGSLQPLRFADFAIDKMVNELKVLGIRKLEAKIAGGGNLFPALLTTQDEQMGTKNVLAVKAVLEKHDIMIFAEHTGGIFGRSLRFELATGIVWIEVRI